MKKIIFPIVWLIAGFTIHAQNQPSYPVGEDYSKREVFITMRDGARLFTSIYEPKNSTDAYPILMQRTPYGCAPYGADKLRTRLGPNANLMKEKYIFVYQDVRGRYKSEGQFQEMTPAIDSKRSSKQTDESSDTYDTIEWLLKNTRTNGRVGIYGISYPGFYASASLPDAHPAIKAVSPQAPVTDEFIGDDCNHNGAYFLLDNFGFYNFFDGERNTTGESYKGVFSVNYTDAYKFFLELGPLKNANTEKYFRDKNSIWRQTTEHDTYDTFWKARNIRPHLKNVKPAVLVVGGWFDAEDLFGALKTYQAIEKQSPKNDNHILMGPWTHGGWASNNWKQFGSYDFGSNLNEHYQEIETKFFNYYLKNLGSLQLPEAIMFETGSNQWKQYATWPPLNEKSVSFYFGANNSLSNQKPFGNQSYSEYVSDPANPVPYTSTNGRRRNDEYMVEDQRFNAKRSDVLVFTSELLKEDMIVAGSMAANLFVSTTGTDADFIVKVIDVLPDDEPNPSPNQRNFQMAGFQRLVRAEVFRGKFRNSYEKPSPFTPGKIENVSFKLNEVDHMFKKGHKIMVQVQSSWFPLVDRNPQKFVDIFKADESDFQKATMRIYYSSQYPSNIVLPVLK